MSEPLFTSLNSIATLPTYNLFIVALGYEERATYVSEMLRLYGEHCLAIGFEHGVACSYEYNKKYFLKNQFDVVVGVSTADFEQSLRKKVEGVLNQISGVSEQRIGIDISCFDRYRLASIVALLNELTENEPAAIDFWYSLAAFTPPPKTMPPNEIVGPIHNAFAGWFEDPGRPLALVVGLGYEPGKALGAAEYLQASKIVAFFPHSPVEKFAEEVNKSNELILSQLQPDEIIHYRVDDPEMTLARLDSVVAGLSAKYNVVLLPLGPKIFSLTALLERFIRSDVSVWRVSEGSNIEPKNIKSSGYFFGLRANFPMKSHLLP